MAPVIGLVQAAATWFAGLSAFGQAAVQVLGSILLNVAATALLSKKASSGQDLLRDLANPTSLPVYRVPYGDCRAVGTPAGWHVDGDTLYICWLVSSRPSVGPFVIFLDEREVELSGDPYDFSGDGAEGTLYPFAGHTQIWIGLGDQTACPDAIASGASEFFRATDAWQGRTVVWARLNIGSNDDRSERWPATPPALHMAGKFTRVWDPRDAAQDPQDEATWVWSANQALCALDALRRNPIRPYADVHLWLETWIWGADVADERAGVRYAYPEGNETETEALVAATGVTIARYEVNGTLAYSDGAELEDQLSPLMIAGAANFVRARGQLGIVPGTEQEVSVTLTDILDGQSATFVRYSERDDLATSVSGTYLAPDRNMEEASLPTYELAGAQDADGGLDQLYQPDLSMVTDHRQGQRVQKILLMRKRMQRVVSAEFPPEAFDAVAGARVETDLAAPFTRWSGDWTVESSQPMLIEANDEGVALRCQMSLREYSSEIYAWDYATEEVYVTPYEFDATRSGVQPPRNVVVDMSAANDQTDAGVVVPRFSASMDRSTSDSVTAYEWQIKLSTDEDWPSESYSFSKPMREATGSGWGVVSKPLESFSMFGGILSQTALQDFRIRARGSRGASAWVEITGLARDFELADVVATGGEEQALFSATAPSNAVFYGVRIYEADVGEDRSLAEMVTALTGIEPGALINVTVSGLIAGDHDYWMVPISRTYTEGQADGPHTLAITAPEPEPEI
ncbi:phage tail protein [Thioclava sp. 'Guangxiensis']|uniref:phage tail protein n=1 Tax=Thioclava sp. 'Guangxiensis' TaxID=3149044 RepID=UPI003877A572